MKENAHDPLTQERLVVVAATIGINIVVVALLILAPWSDWKTGLALNFLDNALLLGYVATQKAPDPFCLRQRYSSPNCAGMRTFPFLSRRY